jgi:hypothetical protein
VVDIDEICSFIWVIILGILPIFVYNGKDIYNINEILL